MTGSSRLNFLKTKNQQLITANQLCYNQCMPENKSSKWEALAQEQPGVPAFPTPNLNVRLTHGAWFGVAMGIGFAIGFLISFLFLLAFVGFVVYSKFPGLFG